MPYDISTPAEAYSLRRDCTDLTEDQKLQAELKCLEDPYWAYNLRLDIADLSEDIKRQLEQKCLESPEWAYWLLHDVTDLPSAIRLECAFKAMEAPEYHKRIKTQLGPIKYKELLRELAEYGFNTKYGGIYAL